MKSRRTKANPDRKAPAGVIWLTRYCASPICFMKSWLSQKSHS